MEYQGFIATIGFDSAANAFYGNVINSVDGIHFRAADLNELEGEFHRSVDEYLKICSENGMLPRMKTTSEGRSWDAVFEALESFSPDFMIDGRDQPVE